jgi:methylenetetrahydrofolate dehydrogenase (NADP+)/methenyltetrahydrofolate cyclohydrolase
VLASDDPAQRRFVELKHEACEALGVAVRHADVPPDGPAGRVPDAVESASADPAVDAVFVQLPLPDHVDPTAVRERVAPAKDADCLHPLNLGRLVAGDPRVEPATPLAIARLLDAHGVDLAGADVTVVGRSAVVGRPLAAMLVERDATVTTCHSRTRDLAARTRGADVVVTAAGSPGLVDGAMLREGATVVDASANWVEEGGERRVVGDVAFESATDVAGAVTPVPGGVGPVTLATLLETAVTLAERRARAGA